FSGALAWFLAEGREFGNAIPLANCVGALATTRPGAQAAMPDLAALKAIAGDLY
ncbi:MAG: ribokinase, partial [Chlorobia bacterium]|nr:ribokinase [Fimbriimonadaceae bacterium]